MTITSYILYLYLHRKHVCKEGQRRSAAYFAYAAPPTERASVAPLIHSLSEVNTSEYTVPTWTYHPVQTHTTWLLRLVMLILLLLLVVLRWKCSVWGSSQGGTKTQVASGSTDDNVELWGLRMCPFGVRVDPSSFFVFSPSSWRSSNIPVMAFMSFLSLSCKRSFILSWRQRRGFPGEFYKCPSGGTVGTSLFPSARKLSSERRQSSAWWESWRFFWSALGCDSQC